MSTATATEPELYDFAYEQDKKLKRPNWSQSLIRLGDREITVSCVRVERLLDILVRLQPKTQEDWKAIYWMICWGYKPSEVERVIVRRQNGFAYMWGEFKDGVQPE